jgi:hypothetical protein
LSAQLCFREKFVFRFWEKVVDWWDLIPWKMVFYKENQRKKSVKILKKKTLFTVFLLNFFDFFSFFWCYKRATWEKNMHFFVKKMTSAEKPLQKKFKYENRRTQKSMFTPLVWGRKHQKVHNFSKFLVVIFDHVFFYFWVFFLSENIYFFAVYAGRSLVKNSDFELLRKNTGEHTFFFCFLVTSKNSGKKTSY